MPSLTFPVEGINASAQSPCRDCIVELRNLSVRFAEAWTTRTEQEVVLAAVREWLRGRCEHG